MAVEPRALRVLLVEDDNLVAMTVEDMLVDIGFELIRNPRNVAEAMLAIEADDWDVAILDVNVAGERVFPVADALHRARKPFIFASGYGLSAIPEEYRGTPVMAKPFRLDELEMVLAKAMTQEQVFNNNN